MIPESHVSGRAVRQNIMAAAVVVQELQGGQRVEK